jgi:hypothetical protein
VSSRHVAWHAFLTALELTLVGAIALFALVLAVRSNHRFDLTPTQEHTLSDLARRTARRLNEDATITVFFNSQEQERRWSLEDLLRQFSEASPRIRYKLYDLDRNPGLAKRYGVVNYNSGVLEAADRTLVLRDVSENEVTTNLIRLIDRQERIVLFSVGHGERDPLNSDPRSGLSQAAKGLEAENYRVERSDDLRAGIAPEVSLVVSVAPSSDWTEHELEALDAHMARGGGVLLLLEAGSPAHLVDYLRGYGIECGNDLIVDERNRFFGGDSFVPRIAYFNQEILSNAGAPPAILPVAQSIVAATPSRHDVSVAPLAYTGDDTWSDRDRVSLKGGTPTFRDGIDHRGPVPVAAIAELAGSDQGKPSGDLVAIGDGDFATNLYIGLLGNRDLFLNLASLTARAEELISAREAIAPGGTFSPMDISARQTGMLFWASVVVLPAIVLLTGATVAWRRNVRSAA